MSDRDEVNWVQKQRLYAEARAEQAEAEVVRLKEQLTRCGGLHDQEAKRAERAEAEVERVRGLLAEQEEEANELEPYVQRAEQYAAEVKVWAERAGAAELRAEQLSKADIMDALSPGSYTWTSIWGAVVVFTREELAHAIARNLGTKTRPEDGK